ncbi:MAG: cytochrome-c peroxidase [Salibacteraceae bacterium]
MIKCFWFILLTIVLGSCVPNDKPKEFVVPEGFEPLNYPEDNPFSRVKAKLGERLFFDTRLSKNGNVSCASCHNPKLAFADSLPLSFGTNDSLGFRNTPSIINAAYKTLFHMDGGVRSLELQVLAPIIDTNELGQNFDSILTYLKSDSIYLKLFEESFDTIPTIFGLTRAIATYERSLIYGESAFDRYLNGDSSALSNHEKKGWELFSSKKLNCISCHSGRLLTNYTFQNIGIAYQFADTGRARVTRKKEDVGKFAVPSLRNVAITAPYMHDGSISSLDSVLVFFSKGGGPHPNKSQLLKPFELSNSEKNYLKAFFSSLTDDKFVKK